MVILLAMITAVPVVYEFIFPEQEDIFAERSAMRKLILIEKDKKESLREKEGVFRKKDSAAAKRTVNLFRFDPNEMSLTRWQLLGFSPKQAAVLMKYTEKGGRFYQKEDLKKMYTVSAEMYARLIPYICIEKTASQQGTVLRGKYPAGVYPSKHLLPLVELNTADTSELIRVNGIGPAFARRIYNYRKRLGGFYKKEQLMEVFGLDSTRYEEIKTQLTIDPGALIKLNINEVIYDELKSHPYLTYKQVNAILQFRKQHGKYSNIADLKRVAILSAETIEKLAPYISFNHD